VHFKAHVARIFLLVWLEGKICQNGRKPWDGGKKVKVRDTEVVRCLEII